MNPFLEAIRAAAERKKNNPIHRHTANSKQGKRIMSQSSTKDIVVKEKKK